VLVQFLLELEFRLEHRHVASLDVDSLGVDG